jgi:hypothetical protein
MTVRGSERQDLPPCLPRRLQPVDEPVRLRSETTARKRGDMELDSARAAKRVHKIVV